MKQTKLNFRRITLLALAIFAMGVGSLKAATETYDFTGFGNNTELKSGTATMIINSSTLYAMETADNTFNGRFAVGPSDRTG
ncbi:MAG: hypothetical protein IJ637_04020, partial [Prevotella sp.]|nr:hypothetical protein [Prevotella sp.]